MTARRRILGLTIASLLGSALASAAGDQGPRRYSVPGELQPNGEPACIEPQLGQPRGDVLWIVRSLVPETEAERIPSEPPQAVRPGTSQPAGNAGEKVSGYTASPGPGTERSHSEAAATYLVESAEVPKQVSGRSCPEGMVEIEGNYCPAAEQICEEYISEPRDRCARFRDKVRCFGTPRPHHFCIDQYEYPNQVGKKPLVAVTWEEARALCAAQGKRLCTAEEWTLACEGPEMWPHPYGFERDPTACNIDRGYIVPRDEAYQNPKTRADEIRRLDQREPSGSRPRCVSPYGVYDLTGNVDEWVYNEQGSLNGPEYDSGLKGGYWAAVRNRCRPITTQHNRWHHGYQIGFRCCSDIVFADADTQQCRETIPITTRSE